MSEEQHLYDKPRTIGEIALYYGVTTRTIRAWLRRCGLPELATRRGTGSDFYTKADLRRIEEKIGN